MSGKPRSTSRNQEPNNQNPSTPSKKDDAGDPAINRQLLEAVFMTNLDQVTILLGKGADINAVDHERNVTPLILAVVRGDIPMAGFLLEHGADPNKGFKQPITEDDRDMIRQMRKMRQDDPGWKPTGDTVANEELILSGKITEIDVSPMGLAMRKHNGEMVALLKKYGAKDKL